MTSEKKKFSEYSTQVKIITLLFFLGGLLWLITYFFIWSSDALDLKMNNIGMMFPFFFRIVAHAFFVMTYFNAAYDLFKTGHIKQKSMILVFASIYGLFWILIGDLTGIAHVVLAVGLLLLLKSKKGRQEIGR